jgi:Gram-negative bacterial TonB protein C-terminal
MMRSLALALVAAFIGLGSATPARGAGADRVYDLLGKWTCRTTDDATATQIYQRTPDEITFIDNVTPRRLPAYSVQGRLQTDHVTGGWSVTMPVNGVFGFHGTARIWDANAWIAEGYALPPAAPVALRERYEWIDADDYRRVFERVTATGTPAVSGEVCRRGDAPPAADACIVRELPGGTLQTVPPQITPEIRRAHLTGTVKVIVSIDADSNVSGARVISSPSGLLNKPALDAARATIFRTAVRDCKPVADDFIFTVNFENT